MSDNPNPPVEILLVDDNPNEVELTLRALRKVNLDNHVHVAHDGAEALEFIYATGAYEGRREIAHPRLILLDLKMPRVDGLEVLHRLKQDERTRAIPVVVLTSSQEKGDIIKTYNYGVNSYIVKPVDFERFVISVAEVGYYWLSLNHTHRVSP